MSIWDDLLQNKEVKRHSPSQSEIRDLLALIERDLKDASLQGLSADRRFATAYNAALHLCKLALSCEGYQVRAKAHHQKTFEFALFAIGSGAEKYVTYFEFCRRKRNTLDYDRAGVVAETESQELLAKTTEFKDDVM